MVSSTVRCGPWVQRRITIIFKSTSFSSTVFSLVPFEDLLLQSVGLWNRTEFVHKPFPGETLFVGRVEGLLGRIPLIPCFRDGNTTSAIPHKYSSRQKEAFECNCADVASHALRRGSHVYEINTLLWTFGRPPP